LACLDEGGKGAANWLERLQKHSGVENLACDTTRPERGSISDAILAEAAVQMPNQLQDSGVDAVIRARFRGRTLHDGDVKALSSVARWSALPRAGDLLSLCAAG
jgi:hypothetical protein